MDDEESLRLFCKECGKADTSFNNSDTLQVWQAAYTVTYSSKYFETPLVGRHNAKKRLIGFGWFNNADSENKNDSLVQKVDEPVRFPGGLDGLSDFIQSNLKYPKEAVKKNISGKIFLKLTVNSFGYIENIIIIKDVYDCAACDFEAIRVASIMPRFLPAKVNGKNVNRSFNLPISFKLN